ncbi:MAG: 7-cyano-7-deazaguanine synthase QueC [Euryarchaeota archaeon]|nr:7-cyano-7-deazaguanine synthase QueC [Euryarchaeota archaeon]
MVRRNKRAVILVSGGLDSCVAGTIAKCEGYEIYALTIDYGQRHAKEIEAAANVAKALRAKEHKTVQVDLSALGGSALTDPDIEVPTDREAGEMEGEIPVTYVPARNTVFLSIALGYAETIEAQAVFIGANAVDYSGYPDCRPEYIEKFDELAALATKQGVEGKPTKVHAPLIEWTKGRIVQEGLNLKAPIKFTWSCYLGGDKQCGRCDSCRLRLKGFQEAGVEDPVPYE